MFFFEKKNQKTFATLGTTVTTHVPNVRKSFFASFFSKKEESRLC
jgi:hypothetical protein